MIEAPGNLARDFDVCDLVLADRHVLGPVHQDVGALQQRVTQEAVGAEVLVLQLLDLVLVGRHPLEPGNRRDHRKDQVQLRVFRNARLDEDRAGARVQAGRQPVDQHLVRIGLEIDRVLVARRQGVPVGHEEKALVLVLQLDPVRQRAVVIAEVQRAGWAHARNDAAALAWLAGHASTLAEVKPEGCREQAHDGLNRTPDDRPQHTRREQDQYGEQAKRRHSQEQRARGSARQEVDQAPGHRRAAESAAC